MKIIGSFVGRAVGHPVFEKLLRFEDIQRSVSISGRRQALNAAGAKLTTDTMGQRQPRRGIMRL